MYLPIPSRAVLNLSAVFPLRDIISELTPRLFLNRPIYHSRIYRRESRQQLIKCAVWSRYVVVDCHLHPGSNKWSLFLWRLYSGSSDLNNNGDVIKGTAASPNDFFILIRVVPFIGARYVDVKNCFYCLNVTRYCDYRDVGAPAVLFKEEKWTAGGDGTPEWNARLQVFGNVLLLLLLMGIGLGMRWNIDSYFDSYLTTDSCQN